MTIHLRDNRLDLCVAGSENQSRVRRGANDSMDVSQESSYQYLDRD